MFRSLCESVLAIGAIIVGLIPLDGVVYRWVLITFGIVLLIHSLTCKKCMCSNENNMPAKAAKKPSRRR